jgi:transposase-like protein
MKSIAQAREKRARAVELLREGKSYDEIAREVGFSHRGSAHRAVSKALAEREIEAVDALRQVELERLDRLQTSIWPRAMNGDVSAINAVLRVIDRRIRLLELARSPEVPDQLVGLVVGPVEEGNTGDATSRRFV